MRKERASSTTSGTAGLCAGACWLQFRWKSDRRCFSQTSDNPDQQAAGGEVGEDEESDQKNKRRPDCVSCSREANDRRPFADATGTNGYHHPAECSGEGSRGAGMLGLSWNDLVHRWELIGKDCQWEESPRKRWGVGEERVSRKNKKVEGRETERMDDPHQLAESSQENHQKSRKLSKHSKT